MLQWRIGLCMSTYRTSKIQINTPLKPLGAINLAVQPAARIVQSKCLECYSLETTMISVTYFCDTFVQAISLGDKMVDLGQKATIPILHNGLLAKQQSQQKTAIAPPRHGTDNKTSSSLIRASGTIDIWDQSQAWDLVYAKFHRLVAIQQESNLFGKDKLIRRNGVPQVEPKKMFRLLIVNFANQVGQILEG